ncbi:hypothetical protein N9N67_10760 [Bacteriovoracaceae bacterium]|nr:hypothetical protein [Bacteriovoracaceae bacterium]
MKKLIIFSVLLISYLISGLYAQTTEEIKKNTTPLVIPVGEAKPDKIKLFFVPFVPVNAEKGLSKDAGEMFKIIKNDFSFYVHSVETVEDKKSSDFIISFNEVKFEANNRELKAKIYSQESKKEVYTKIFKFSNNRLSKDSHFVANSLYREVFKKKSIFNSKIFFISDRQSTKLKRIKELYWMDFDGRHMERLTDLKSIVISPDVRKDNKKVLFSSYGEKSYINKHGKKGVLKNLNLYEIDMDTRKVRLISDRDGLNSGAIYSHNPNFIYITLTIRKNADIYRMNINTKEITPVTRHTADDVDPSIIPTGDQMAMLSSRPGSSHIYTLDPNTLETNVKRISFAGKYNSFPRYSPNSQFIIFSSWRDAGFDIFRLDAKTGKNLVRLTKNFGSNEEANFALDSEFIVFTSQRYLGPGRVTQDIYLINTEGEIIRRISDRLGVITSPRFSK